MSRGREVEGEMRLRAEGVEVRKLQAAGRRPLPKSQGPGDADGGYVVRTVEGELTGKLGSGKLGSE